MITEDKLNQMYESAIACTRLTTKEMKELGFNQHDLANLVQHGRLVRVKKGQYEVVAKDLYNYGKILLKSGRFEEAYHCFVACNELEPHNINTLLQLFFRNIVNKNYAEAFKYFEEIYESSECTNDKSIDNYLYLYLLSYITNIPDKYQIFLKNISFEDIEIKKQSRMYPDVKIANLLRKDILEQKFSHVLKKTMSMKAKRGFSSLRELILIELLKQAQEEKDKNMNSLISFINTKDYSSVVLILEAEKELHPLPITLEYVLTLAHDYLKIENTGVVPPLPNFGISNIFNAISNNDYKRALELYICRSEMNSIAFENNILYKVLVDINTLIDSLSIELVGEEQLSFKGFELPKELDGEQLEIPNFVDSEVTYADVVSTLVGRKVEETSSVIDRYFKQKGIEQYRYIFDNLLIVCQMENDLSYSKAMLELAHFSNPNYKLDISPYIQEFYLALSTNLYLVAQQYLNIIEGTNRVLPNKINVEVLKETLVAKMNKVELNEKEEQISTSVVIVGEQSKKEDKVSELNTKPVKRVESVDQDQKFVESKIAVFEAGEDVVILKSMNSERRRKIHQIVAAIPNVKSFSIGSSSTRKVVLTNSPYIEGRINKRELFIEGDKAYREHDYEKCIDCYRQLLYFVKPNQKVYAKLGLCYLRKNNLERAITYLTIATELNRELGGSYDFTELIEKISGKSCQQEEKKPNVKMSEDEFLDENNHYGVKYISEISRMVFTENVSLEEACRRFNYDTNQMNIIRLIYAEDYYSIGDYKSGDALFKLVSESKNKSKRVKIILENVRLRKKFYKNRPREENFVCMYR